MSRLAIPPRRVGRISPQHQGARHARTLAEVLLALAPGPAGQRRGTTWAELGRWIDLPRAEGEEMGELDRRPHRRSAPRTAHSDSSGVA